LKTNIILFLVWRNYTIFAGFGNQYIGVSVIVVVEVFEVVMVIGIFVYWILGILTLIILIPIPKINQTFILGEKRRKR